MPPCRLKDCALASTACCCRDRVQNSASRATRGQLVATTIPEDDRLDAFGIDVSVGLAPEFAGTTGRVHVNVFGCPAGTDAGTDRDGWANECQALAGGVPSR